MWIDGDGDVEQELRWSVDCLKSVLIFEGGQEEKVTWRSRGSMLFKL